MYAQKDPSRTSCVRSCLLEPTRMSRAVSVHVINDTRLHFVFRMCTSGYKCCTNCCTGHGVRCRPIQQPLCIQRSSKRYPFMSYTTHVYIYCSACARAATSFARIVAPDTVYDVGLSSSHCVSNAQSVANLCPSWDAMRQVTNIHTTVDTLSWQSGRASLIITQPYEDEITHADDCRKRSKAQ